jgi:FlaA1/EpsC-like NDP-sugar epimerase
MIKEREQQINNIFGVLDVVISVFSFFVAYLIRNLFFEPPLSNPNEYLIVGLLIIPTWFILLKSVHLTEMPRMKTYSKILFSYLKVIAFGMGVIFLFMFIFKLHNISRLVILFFGIINFFSLFSLRITIFRIMKYFRVKGFNSRNVVVVADDSSEAFIEKIMENREWGYILKYIITNSSKIYKKYKDIVSIHPEHVSIRNLIDVDIIDEVIFCKNEINQNRLRSWSGIPDAVAVV